jgi:hypothetical protein
VQRQPVAGELSELKIRRFLFFVAQEEQQQEWHIFPLACNIRIPVNNKA